jgi:hypothetical protein
VAGWVGVEIEVSVRLWPRPSQTKVVWRVRHFCFVILIGKCVNDILYLVR